MVECDGIVRGIAERSQRWLVTDDRKRSDENGRKEMKEGVRKVFRLGSKRNRQSEREYTRIEMPLQWPPRNDGKMDAVEFDPVVFLRSY